MSAFPGSPRVLKGALIGLDPFNPLASLVVFQYNPEKLTRTLAGRFAGGRAVTGAAGGGGSAASAQPLRITGPPTETLSVEVVIDATDQLERDERLPKTFGVYPALSALEMLLYPKTALVVANAVLAQAGLISVQNPEAPLVLFAWGVQRILPVRITQFTINEEIYDPSLNPIQARVQLGLTVLNYDDLGLLSAGGAIFMAHQVLKETMATINGVGAVAGFLTGG